MPRLTRVERQAQTKAELLQAAKARFLHMGYAATTLEDIAEQAGYSKGAVYSNFPDKPTLCWEALDLIHREKMAEVESIIIAENSLGERFSALAQWLDASLGDVGWTMLEFEFVVLSRHDSRLAQMVADLREDWHRMATATLRGALESCGIAADEPGMGQLLSDTANLLLCTGSGLSIQRAIAPSASTRSTKDAIQGFLDFARTHFGFNIEEMRGLNPI